MSAVPIHTLDQRVALFRQPVVERGRTVRAYAVRAAVTSADGGWLDEQDAALAPRLEPQMRSLVTPTIMRDTDQAELLARRVLEFLSGLSR